MKYVCTYVRAYVRTCVRTYIRGGPCSGMSRGMSLHTIDVGHTQSPTHSDMLDSDIDRGGAITAWQRCACIFLVSHYMEKGAE